ncbi:MAG: hypothetical protein IVW54_08850 [Candidatus Binataceae bacterium]|nr:hypothetical protein [Candidatus Binataceae bacterium]
MEIKLTRQPEDDRGPDVKRTDSGRMRRIINSLLLIQSGGYPLQTPRRAIDREAQQYSPFYE